jgi:hypothetical protein
VLVLVGDWRERERGRLRRKGRIRRRYCVGALPCLQETTTLNLVTIEREVFDPKGARGNDVMSASGCLRHVTVEFVLVFERVDLLTSVLLATNTSTHPPIHHQQQLQQRQASQRADEQQRTRARARDASTAKATTPTRRLLRSPTTTQAHFTNPPNELIGRIALDLHCVV